MLILDTFVVLHRGNCFSSLATNHQPVSDSFDAAGGIDGDVAFELRDVMVQSGLSGGAIAAKQSGRGASGGTGRRAGLRSPWGNPWRFESSLAHHLS